MAWVRGAEVGPGGLTSAHLWWWGHSGGLSWCCQSTKPFTASSLKEDLSLIWLESLKLRNLEKRPHRTETQNL